MEEDASAVLVEEAPAVLRVCELRIGFFRFLRALPDVEALSGTG